MSAKQKIKVILEKLLDRHLLGSENDNRIQIRIDSFLSGTNVEKDEFLKIIDNLEEKQVIIKIDLYKEQDNQKTWYPSEKGDLDWNLCYVYVPTNDRDPSFGIVNFRELAKSYIDELSNKDIPNNNLLGMLYFEKNGDFWHGDKNKFNYPIRTKRLEIVKYLIENRDGENYLPTKKIAYAVNKDEHQVMTEIDKIRGRIKTLLDLDDVIESKTGLGYRINPKYIIVTKYSE